MNVWANVKLITNFWPQSLCNTSDHPVSQRILMLSIAHQLGHGVAVVLDIQARYLASCGHEVFMGGPLSQHDFAYPNCTRVALDNPQEAAQFANQNGIQTVIMHTPPFYSTVRWLNPGVFTLAYDYGEPNPAFFPDAEMRTALIVEKNFSIGLANEVYAISQSVKAESPNTRCQVLSLGNSHLAIWGEKLAPRRLAARSHLALVGQTLVLNVCRYHQAERYYKGIDIYLRVRDVMHRVSPQAAGNIIFAIAGRAIPDDIKVMQEHGLRVFANLSNEELIDLYCAADIYANFSRWEGYNLGIGQALAMGLPVVASDIPAHRAFDIFTTNDPALAAKQLLTLAEKVSKAPNEQASAHLPRRPIVTPWSAHTKQLGQILQQCIR